MTIQQNEVLKFGAAGLALLKEFEGYHTKLPNGDCKAYLDTVANPHVWTIGYGSIHGVREGDIWTREKAELELCKELAVHEAIVKRYIQVPMNQNQFDALVSFSYNFGMSHTRCPSLIRAVNNGDWQLAGNLLVKLYGGVKGTPVKGLVRRRAAERDLMWRTPKEDLVTQSRKLQVLGGLKTASKVAIPAGGMAEYLGYLTTMKEFITNNPYWFIGGGLLAFWFLMKWLEQRTIDDHEDGRYTPSNAPVYVAEETPATQDVETKETPDAEPVSQSN